VKNKVEKIRNFTEKAFYAIIASMTSTAKRSSKKMKK